MATHADRFTTATRDDITRWWDLTQALLARDYEFSSAGFSGTVTDGDLAEENPDVTATLLSDTIGSIEALRTWLDTGHKTNFSKMLKR